MSRKSRPSRKSLRQSLPSRQPRSSNFPRASRPRPQSTAANHQTVKPSNRASWAQRAREALAVPDEVAKSTTDFATDPAVLYRWRDEMADLIEEAAEARQSRKDKAMNTKATTLATLAAFATGAANAAGEASPAMFDKAAGAVRIPEGERLRILQLTDTQIIDSSQRRSPNRISPSEIKKWLPENAEANCYSHIRDPADGTGNYAVRIYQGDRLLEMVYMLDSHGCGRAAEKSIRIPRSITENQCRMMERIAKEAEREAGKLVPAIAAWHIPTPEFLGACKALGYPTEKGTVIGVTVPARLGDFGAILETSIPAATPERFAERLRGCGVNAVFAGHCHNINISVMWNGIRWTMGMKTGTYDYHINGAIGGTLAEFDGGVPTVRHIPTLAGY